MSRQKKKFEEHNLPPELVGTKFPQYRRLRRNIIVITFLVALAPLVVLTIINYLQDKDAYRTESHYAVTQILSNTKRTLESVIEERRSALALVISEHEHRALESDSALASTLRNLKNSFGGFIDLGLIDSTGLQSYYTGPYDLKNRSYEDQSWFHEVVLRGSYVSDVFMGYRNFPHFVIAFKHDRNPGGFYILRATLDMELLNRQVYSLNLDRYTDAFIMNKDGILQTASVFYGPALKKAAIEVPPMSSAREIVEENREEGKWVVSGYTQIEGSPFVLIVIKRLEGHFSHWLGHRSQVLWFLAVSTALILLVIIYGADHMTKKLREADLRRAKEFHNMEYTNKMATIGRMAASVAHEINNPMAIINEKAGLIHDLVGFSAEFPQREKMLGLVNSIVKSVDRCSKVTHRLLGFAKRMEIRREQINIRELIDEVVGFQRTEALHRNINITYDFADDLPSIVSDRGQLQQVLLNLINNAFAAVDSDGKVDISVACPDRDSVTIAVTDNGTGIPAENLQHIFEPFFSTKREFGTGLGLSITRDIVEKLGGKIEVESELGKGTRFIVILPVQTA